MTGECSARVASVYQCIHDLIRHIHAPSQPPSSIGLGLHTILFAALFAGACSVLSSTHDIRVCVIRVSGVYVCSCVCSCVWLLTFRYFSLLESVPRTVGADSNPAEVRRCGGL